MWYTNLLIVFYLHQQFPHQAAPYVFADDSKLSPLPGTLSNSYDSSGYYSDYLLSFDAATVAASINQDLQTFQQQNWVSRQTSLLTWSLTVYNPSVDLWAALDLMLEFDTTEGVARPKVLKKVFRPALFETEAEAGRGVCLHLRALGAVYVLFLVMSMEVEARHEQ